MCLPLIVAANFMFTFPAAFCNAECTNKLSSPYIERIQLEFENIKVCIALQCLNVSHKRMFTENLAQHS